MSRVFVAFVFLTAAFFFSIRTFRAMTGKEQLALAKLVSYSILCSVMSAIVLTAIVILF